jgi:signal peptidase I
VIWLVLTAATVVVGTIVVAVVLRRRFAVVDVDGHSMQPTLRPGDRVLVRRVRPDRLRVGDIVVIESFLPGPLRSGRLAHAARGLSGRQWIVKRVAAGPGDPVPASLDQIEGVRAGEPVPGNRFVLLGDNAAQSSDSRTHGFYRGEDVLGVMLRPMR